ncbi:MAG: MotA/TolQ/ExbB proton channel family protein [Candidatus Moranbacteria bacterium]|nr:MotA/TolQ/ExbB proton channel family protein [Candidatus Moranbacteria bacterium]
MNYLTNILYWISTSLLIPVIVILLVFLFLALVRLGGFYGIYMSRMKLNKEVNDALKEIRSQGITPKSFDRIVTKNSLFYEYVSIMKNLKWDKVHSQKAIADFEIAGEKELELSKTLMRLGPMLGLMGTLIPMGPALVGLASGDIGSMAINMQVAFSTTVVGIFIGAIGYITQLVKQRWYVEDLNNLQYIYELASTQRG